MLQIAGYVFLMVVLYQTPTLNGWSKDQIIFLFGMTAAALGTCELLFNNIWMVPTYVIMGDLDRLLTYPVNSLAFLLVTRPELHAFGNLLTGITCITVSVARLHVPWYYLPLIPFWILCGSVLYAAALTMSASLSFKILGPNQHLLMLPHTLLQSTRYPLSIYPKWIHFVLLFLIPYGTFHFLPGSFLFDKGLIFWGIFIAPLAAFLFMWEASFAWRWGLSKYESTGS
jgi:ABC-2 type transport system permease protein